MRRLTRRIWGILFTLIIAVAVMVQLGREAFPLLNDYREDISQIIGKRLGVKLTIGRLSAKWKGLRPQIDLHDVTVSSRDGERIFTIEQVVAELSLVDSALNLGASWRRLAFHHLNTTLQQNEAGHWQIKSLPLRQRSSRSFSIEDPLDIFLFGRRVELDNATFNLEFRTGHTSVLSIPRITLENDRDFHRATASAGVLDNEEDQQQHFKLVVEATGNPREPDNFSSKGYLRLERFPMEKVVAAFAGSHWQEQGEQRWGEGHRLDLELWYSGTARSGIQLSGKLQSDGLPLEVPEHVLLPEGLAADITGSWDSVAGWSLMLQHIGIRWPEFESPSLNVNIRGGVGQPLRLGVASIDIEPWHKLAQKMGFVQGKVAKTVNALSPAGILTGLDIVLTSKEEGYFRLNAGLHQASVEAIVGAPQIQKLDGFVSATAFEGYVDIDSSNGFSLYFPKVYKKPLLYDIAKGRVAWQIDTTHELAYVSSGRLQLEQGDEKASGYLRLKLPMRRDGREPEMILTVGVAQAPVSLHRKYVPKVVPRSLYSWLSRSIGEGTATDIGFIFHGSLSKSPEVAPNIQLVARVEDGDLAFDPQWPALKNITGQLTLDNLSLDVQVEQATLLNNRVNNAEVLLVQNPEDEGRALSITGQIDSNAAAAMDLLQQSPVRNLFGSTFDSWTFGGDVSARIALLIPLSLEAQGLRQSVDVDFDGARVDMRDIDLAINNVKGRLHYDSDSGLSAKTLRGRVWGKPLVAEIHSPQVTDQGLRDTVIEFNGPVAIADLRDWTRRPELGFAAGQATVNGRLTIPAKGTKAHFFEVEMRSPLRGVGFDLPEPMNKMPDSSGVFSMNLRLLNGEQRYQFDFGDDIHLRLLTGSHVSSSGQLSIGVPELPLAPGFFDVVGRVGEFDLQVWDAVRERYFTYLEDDGQPGAPDDTNNDLPIRLNLDIDQTTFGDALVENVHVDGLGTKQQWDLRVESALAAGDIIVASNHDNLDLTLNLDYLRLEPEADIPSGDTGAAKEAWRMADIDLSKVTFPVTFSVEELSFAGKPYGRWAFYMEPLLSGDGIALSNIHANIRGMAVGEAVTAQVDAGGGQASRSGKSPREKFAALALSEPHAQFIWRQTPNGDHSYFNGTLMARDIDAVLEAWDFENVLDSRQGIVDAAVSWPGAPDEIQLKTVQGKVIFDLEDGNFIRGTVEADTGLLRLIALFNFDTIVRRLKLDFSDLAKEGFGFESVHGEFNFRDGEVLINQPLVVDSTSSKIQLAGTLDVIDEKIDADLVATLPVAGDITVAAALVAGLPAAVGVFLVSKMFESQVDKASSITYSIKGDWADPKIKFRKIFSDTGAALKGLEVRNRERTVTREDVEGIDFSDDPRPTPVPE